jgi:predicted phosphodiesterase
LRLAFFSDLHAAAGNLERLLALLEHEGVGRVYNLGDAVGYSGDADRTFDLLRERGVVGVLGNHDLEALARPDPNVTLRTADGREVGSDFGLSPASKSYIRGLPRQIVETQGDVRFGASHGLISSYAGAPLWENVTAANAAEFLAQVGVDLAFAGNAHEQYYVELAGGRARLVEVERERELQLRSGRRYAICAGSAAAPSGDPPRPGFVIVEPESMVVQFRRYELK